MPASAQSDPPPGATARWTLVDRVVNPDGDPLVFENFHEPVGERADGRRQIDRDVTDQFFTGSIGANSFDYTSRQVVKSRVTGEVKGEVTYSARFTYSPPPQEFFEFGEQARVPIEITGSYSITRSGNTDRGAIVSPVRFTIGLTDANILVEVFDVGEEMPNIEDVYEFRPLRSGTGRLIVKLRQCEGCEVFYHYVREPLDPDSAPPRPDTAPTQVPALPTATPLPAATPQGPSRSDAALDDLISTFGRMTQEIAEERIREEIPDQLEDLADWLGAQMQGFFEASEGFLDDIYDSLPEFAWEEEQAEGAIPDEVDEQPDDPGGPGISFEERNDLLSSQVKIPLNMDVESGEELFDLISSLTWKEDAETGRFTRTRTAGGEVIELRRTDGTTVTTGVYVTPDGRVLYSTDGSNYYPTLSDAIDPSFGTRGVELYNGMRDFVWRRTLEGSLRDKERQLINDVSQEVLDEFRREMSGSSASSAPEDVFGELKDPFKDIKSTGSGADPYLALEGKATKSASDYIEGKLWDPIKDTLKAKRDEFLWAAAEAALDNSVEFEARQNLKFVFKEYKDAGEDIGKAWAQIKKDSGLDLFELTDVGKRSVAAGEFMVAAVQQMGKGLQDSDFGVRARQYIALREEGKSPRQLWSETRDGQQPLLEFSSGGVTRSGLESVMAQQGIQDEVHLGVSFSLYEQAYQRFVLAQRLGRQGS